MAGTVALVGVLGVTVAVAMGLGTVGAAAAFSARLAGTADAAALAAADSASGAVLGVPCEQAARIAELADAAISSCDLDGLIATVSVTASFGALPAGASARAGPPSVVSP